MIFALVSVLLFLWWAVDTRLTCWEKAHADDNPPPPQQVQAIRGATFGRRLLAGNRPGQCGATGRPGLYVRLDAAR